MRFDLTSSLAAFALASAPLAAEVLSQDVANQLGVVFANSQRLQVPSTPAAEFSVGVELDGRDYVLDLVQHSLRAPGYRLIVQQPDGSYVDGEPGPVLTYRGTVRGVEGSLVAAHLVHGGLDAEVQLPGAQGVFGIEPLASVLATAETELHGVYNSMDALSFGTCGTPEQQLGEQLVPQGTGGLAGVGNPEVAMIAVDTDFEFYQANGSSVAATEGSIEGTINAVEAIYDSQMDILYEISAIIVRSASNDPYTTSNASTFLNQLRNHWIFNQGGIQRDIVHLFSGKSLDGQTIGIAFFNTMCSTSNGYGLSQRIGGSGQTALTAHELGHNWAASHCNAQADCRIMCDNIGGVGCTPGTNSDFGPTSINSILNKKNSVGCLSDPTPPSAPQLVSVFPQFIDALNLNQVTISGSNFTGATSIQIGTATLAPTEFTVVSSGSITIPKILAEAIGTNTVTVTTPVGTSNAGLLFVAETNPALINNPGLGIPGFEFVWDIGASPDDFYLLSFALAPTTAPVGGFDVLQNSGLIFSGTLTPAGTGQESVIVPILGLLNLYFQATFFDPVSLAFTGSTNVSTALVF